MITWEEVDRLIDHLVPQFTREFTAMVLITRGGIVPGGMLADAMDITHILTAAVDFPAKLAREKSIMAWPDFIQFPAEDKLRGRPTLIVDDVWGSGRSVAQPDGTPPVVAVRAHQRAAPPTALVIRERVDGFARKVRSVHLPSLARSVR